MRETPRSQVTASDSGTRPPQPRTGCALAHTPGASGSGTPHRSDGRPPQTPRGARQTDQNGRPGTIPPVPGRPSSFPLAPPVSRATPASFPSPFLLFSLFLLFLLFSLLAWLVSAAGSVSRADERLGRAMWGGLPGPGGEFLADLGNVQVAVPVLVLAVVYAAVRGRRAGLPRWWWPPLAAAVVMAAVPALVAPLKSLLARPGPPGAGPDGCFPSGHATTAAVAYGAAALLLLPAVRRAATRWLLGTGTVVLNAAVGAGLVVRGYHWPLDVVGGWLLSGLLLGAWVTVTGSRAGSAAAGSDRSGRGA